jgi:hypothetical protein
MSTTTLKLDHDPLTPLDPLMHPTPEAVRKLRQEIYTNAQNVTSSLGGGHHGHLGMVMPTAEYRLISHGGAAYVFPDKPEIPFYSGSSRSTRDRQHAQYRLDFKEYDEARALRSQLKGLLIQAIPVSYREVLEDPNLGYANVTPQHIIQHLIDNYGGITVQDLDHNLEQLLTPWDPDTTITTVFTNGTRQGPHHGQPLRSHPFESISEQRGHGRCPQGLGETT